MNGNSYRMPDTMLAVVLWATARRMEFVYASV